MSEIWKDIKGAEGFYQVSNCGRIKSVAGIAYRDSVFGNFQKKERILKCGKNQKGYIQFSFSRGNRKGITMVSRLVAEAFIPNKLNKPQVNHINGIVSDNHATNLEWCTNSENQLHAYRTGLTPSRKGKGVKILSTEREELVQLNTMYGLDHTLTGIEYGVCSASIGRIIKTKSVMHPLRYKQMCENISTGRVKQLQQL
jgi:hypothetical protein